MGRSLKVATIKLKHVHSFTDRHGKRRHYFRRNGLTVALPGVPGSQKFMEAYGAALARQAAPTSRQKAAEGTFRALAIDYFTSPDFQSLKATTRTVYKRVIDGFLMEHGHRRVDQMQRSHVKKIVGKMVGKPGAQKQLLKRIRTLINFAIEAEWIEVDPTRKIKMSKSIPFHTWTEEEIAQFEARWPVGTTQRLGFALHLYTGQRGSDVHRMTWADISAGAIRVVQQKTGAKVEAALHPELLAILERVPRKHVAIIVTEFGRPFTVKGFGQYMADAIHKAELPDRCKAHGLRKAAARRLAEAGCTVHEIMSITGHQTVAEVERYTKEANLAPLARRAIGKQVANDAHANRVANPKEDVAI